MASSSSRLKREEWEHTKHDSVFSNWQILIGPSDWEDYSSGKDGVERYKIHNLPIGCLCPGLYELGVAAVSNSESYRSRKHTSDKIIVVYLGEADNIRIRLQQYGRAGSHLDHENRIKKTSCLQRGPGLFKEIFSRGYSIMFRWVPMTNKKEAEKMEAQLLGVFDYAWNRRGNGSCRREDILLKLDSAAKSPVRAILIKLKRWKLSAFDKKVGIKISTSWPLDEVESSNGGYSFLLPRVFKIFKSQPRLVPGDDSRNTGHNICGVANGDGSVCKNRPVDGRKRCIEHKGKKISGTKLSISREGSVTKVTFNLEDSKICGVVTGDGYVCRLEPVSGRKRCEEHKGKKINRKKISATNSSISREGSITKGTYNPEDSKICGVVTGDGYVCRLEPVSGRKRCEEHRGKKINRTSSIINRKVSVEKLRPSAE